jgi:hypothetical protein
MMKKKMIIISIFIIIQLIFFSGCLSGDDEVSTNKSSDPPATPTNTSTPSDLEVEDSIALDPVQLLSAPSFIWPSNKRVKDVSISNNGDYLGGLTTQKVIVQTPTENLFTNIIWINANLISFSDSGEFFAIADGDFVKLYDNEGYILNSYHAGGTVNRMCLLNNGTIIQGGEKTPHLSAVESDGTQSWVWNPGSSTARVQDFDYSQNADRMPVGVNGNIFYCVSDNGKYIWYKDVSGEIEDVEMSDDGSRYYILTTDDIIYSFDKYGNKNWEKELNVNTVEIAIDKQGEYILTKPGDSGAKVFLLDKHGDVEWMKPLSDVGVISISDYMEYVVISEKRELRMYDLAGNEVASYHLDGEYGTFFVCLDMTPDVSKMVLGTTNSMLVFG